MISLYNAKGIDLRDKVIRLYVAVDETGNLGKSLPREREYVLVGTVVRDRDEFERMTRRESRLLGHEVKFNTDPLLREKILSLIEPCIEAVYYVRYRKDKSIHNTRSGMTTVEKHDLHMAMMRALADAIITEYGSEIRVDIGANSLVREYEAVMAFKDNPQSNPRLMDVNVQDSSGNYGLQSNDFIVGIVGHMVNGGSSSENDCHGSHGSIGIIKGKLKRVFLKGDDRRDRR